MWSTIVGPESRTHWGAFHGVEKASISLRIAMREQRHAGVTHAIEVRCRTPDKELPPVPGYNLEL
jgi:hypothetical protein